MIAVRMVAFGEYVEDGTASAMKARDCKGATDLVTQPMPINTMIALRHEALGEGTGFGIGDAGDPSFTLTKGHSHAVAQPISIHPHCIGRAPEAGPQGKEYLLDGSAYCMDSRGHPQAVAAAMQVRRLTPIECERLQGFPDNYTNIPWTEYQRIQKQAAKAGTSFEAELKKRGKVLHTTVNECPDGPRYKALGNSWAVPNVRWIGKRIQEALNASS